MNSDLPDYLSPEHVKRVQDTCNAVMETKLDCKFPNSDCLECGDAECFMIFEAHAELLGMTLNQMMSDWKRQRELDEKAAEAQTRRYEYMAKIRAHEERVKAEKLLKKEQYERNIFDKVA